MIANYATVDWVDGNLQHELRWGIKKRSNKALLNSTLIAKVTRNSDSITDSGPEVHYTVKFSTLFSIQEEILPDTKFDTLAEAKAAVLRTVSKEFLRLATETSIRQGEL